MIDEERVELVADLARCRQQQTRIGVVVDHVEFAALLAGESHQAFRIEQCVIDDVAPLPFGDRHTLDARIRIEIDQRWRHDGSVSPPEDYARRRTSSGEERVSRRVPARPASATSTAPATIETASADNGGPYEEMR